MAKQQKKSTARRTPRASEPRMYGDGKPSQPTGEQSAPVAEQTAAERTPTARTAPVRPAVTGTPGRAPAARTPRAAGTTPRGAGATGSFGRVDRITDYGYVLHDMRRLGITAAAILGALVVLGIIIH